MIFAHGLSLRGALKLKHQTIAEIHRNVEQREVKGFLAADEAEALWCWAQELGHLAPCLEIGSYCGKSTIYLAAGCARAGGIVYAVDHHRGSEEHQRGEQYHDEDLYDLQSGLMNSFPSFQRNIEAFELSQQVIPIVSSSQQLAKVWAAPLSLVFIDGGHSEASARHDCLAWSEHLLSGGLLAVHDIFARPEDGGQGPYNALQAVLAKEEFELIEQVRSMALVRRL